MNEQECLNRMIAPGQKRSGKLGGFGGVIQIHITRACDKSCFACTQGSNLRGKATFITLDNFERAVLSLKDYFGVVGVFGGNPALHPQFDTLCDILDKHIPFERRGLWCNNPAGKAKRMRGCFNPAVSNLNVHLDIQAYEEFKRDWPESMPFGMNQDSRHSPPYVAMKDVVSDEAKRWELISNCDINQHWSAMIAQFRGGLRAYFCEIAGAQSILHQDDPDYPDTGIKDPHIPFTPQTGGIRWWWQLPMTFFADQVRKHCHDCGIPLRGYGELAQEKDSLGTEQVSKTHANIYKPKRPQRSVAVVDTLEQLHYRGKKLETMTKYLQNSTK